MNALVNWLASWAETLRVKAFGAEHGARFPGQTDEGDRAWREFQDRVAAERSAARSGHKAIREIDARQRAIVNKALAGPVQGGSRST